ncbi:helix-turn-helix transcriptional regulator [Anoxybacillus flavithermus]|uniref:helix-turn-helix transcriptional regulator n=1 Tax=Anoxybacillus flavithermus TaxID=33934 RepID=UPI0018680DDF|nr:helix-turn-helix transcriptional regulator [Anoxybacillus flavithermus]MBE2926583.1 helix-turn-helix transcriptional regulator [Anoxybacillus flavithermus]MBE2937454.1 helix-turn-helix transcriptional regulator [Anoxybacillus flavithermus]MBE2945124.1 helix-turn-helix transcriptional regulator [Anoxybacillus flavithermus]MBE2948116.1 helix-turn-helix transcriptional regulator [Anoxybacillus flavithermus]
MNKIKKVRILMGMTQKDVAKQIGITQAMYSMIENEKRKPSKETAAKIEEMFGVSLFFVD